MQPDANLLKEKQTFDNEEVTKPSGLLQKIIAPELPTIFSHIFFPCLEMHVIYLPHINMSVLTKKKKKKRKKTFKFLSPVAAVAGWEGMFISFMILTAALNLRQHKACKKELSVSFIISKKVPLEAEE